MTRVFQISEEEKYIKDIVQILLNDGTIVFPTDTVWGIGGISKKSLDKIREWKGRDSNKPMAMYFSSIKKIQEYGLEIPDYARVMCENLLPGRLTVIVPGGKVDKNRSVGIRIPDMQWLLALLDVLPSPLIGTSANISGSADPVTFNDALDVFAGMVDAAVATDTVPGGSPSTVVDITGSVPRILRHGAITEEEIRQYF